MKPVIRIFILIIATVANYPLKPVHAVWPFSSKPKVCDISVSPSIINLNDITRDMLGKDNTINRQVTLNVHCSEKRKVEITKKPRLVRASRKGLRLIKLLRMVKKKKYLFFH